MIRKILTYYAERLEEYLSRFHRFTEQRLRLGNLQIHASMICHCARLARSLTDWKTNETKEEGYSDKFLTFVGRLSINKEV